MCKTEIVHNGINVKMTLLESQESDCSLLSPYRTLDWRRQNIYSAVQRCPLFKLSRESTRL
ncbi:hypothetical protein A3Q56_03774 [Intoshia linei]|uniref:Uncharacterized protein n=1 Tax=Intoshia linei TaxID=1819745 RepID=A0A177B2J0_9BILA|nr:hypothetical protein A3Q56_03774 [Intoshia linei]